MRRHFLEIEICKDNMLGAIQVYTEENGRRLKPPDLRSKKEVIADRLIDTQFKDVSLA